MTIAINLTSPNDIGDYNSLVAKLQLWLDRTDLLAYIPTFISLTESYLNRELRTPEMEAAAPVVLSGNSFNLPADFLAMRGLVANGVPLNAMSPAGLLDAYGTDQGCPIGFSMSGRTITLGPDPSALTTQPMLTLSYWQRIPGLNANNPSNWLVTSNPDVYLFGALAHAHGYIDSPDDINRWTALFQASVDSLTTSANKQRWGGPIKMRTGVRQVCNVLS